MKIYLIGSLRNPKVPEIGHYLRSLGHDVFDDWHEAGPEADDFWKAGEVFKGKSYKEALSGYAAQHVFKFDQYHLNRCDSAILILPAGISGHLELGYIIGQEKPGYILLPPEKQLVKLSSDWNWLAGLYEGEGSITASKTRGIYYPRLSIASTDKDVLDKVVNITKISKVLGPYKKNLNSFGKKEIYFWQPGKLEDIIYIIRGIWHDLSKRRKQQIINVVTKIGLDDDFKSKTKPPYEFRWDVMYNFAKGVYFDIEDLGRALSTAR